MITPRRTRLIRVPDLHAFRRVISVLWSAGAGSASPLVVVPTKGAAHQLSRVLARVAPPPANAPGGDLVTRDQLYEYLHARLTLPPRRLTLFEREAIAQAAAAEASTIPGVDASSSTLTMVSGAGSAGTQAAVPFQLRPGLVSEILRFYDQLRRQSQQVGRFSELIEEAVGGAATVDVGAQRVLAQTQFLVRTFRAYERRVLEANACDEHTLRDRLIAEPIGPPIKHIVITTPDWIGSPEGLFAADFDLLARLPGVEALDMVCTESLLGSGFHARLHNWWPGLEEVDGMQIAGSLPIARPLLLVPEDGTAEDSWFTLRDREEELQSIADRIARERAAVYERHAVVYKRPLPYLYLAPETFGAAAIPYQTSDALPLAAEPAAAAVDLVFDLVETSFSRDAIVALLRSPQYRFESEAGLLTREQIGALDRGLSDARYLGELSRLEEIAASWRDDDARPALDSALAAARELAPLLVPAPASVQIHRVLTFLHVRARPLDGDDPFEPRERRARAAVVEILSGLLRARAAHHDETWTIPELAAAVRRWIQEETFAPVARVTGVQLVDDQAAPYGDFDDLTLVGLVENEWPERSRRNIFYSPALLKSLGWPTEKDRRAAADARFLDLLGSASRRVRVSTITLDDETMVMRSSQLDEIPRAHLSTALEPDHEPVPPTSDNTNLDADGGASELQEPVDDWAAVRRTRPSSAAPEFHGTIGQQDTRPWSVSALETYLGCPFKFFAQHLLRLDEEPDDEETLDPRRQGQLLHDVFETFLSEWQRAGRGAITPENLDDARAMFIEAVDRTLEQIPEAEAGLERTRLLGSSAAAGVGEAVLRMEAERPVPVVERLLEHRLEGAFSIATSSGPRVVAVRGKADRLDLLADGTFRVIDYKLGWPPDRGRALQLPIYGICAEQYLTNARGRDWRLGEAAYVAFKGPRRVVPLFTSSANRDEVLAKAQQRLADTLDAIERGDFPPTPDDVHRCETCSFSAVCRKDYVGDL